MWKSEPDSCPVLVAFGAYRAAVRLDKLLDDCQSDTCPPCDPGAGTVSPEKTLEQKRNIICRNNRTAVGEDGCYAVRGALRRNCHDSLAWGVFPGVVGQIANRLQQFVAVCAHQVAPRIELPPHVNLLVLEVRPVQVHDLEKQLVEKKLLAVEKHLGGIGFCQLLKVLHQAYQAQDFLFKHPERFRGWRYDGIAEALQVTTQICQGGAQFM